VNELLNFDLEMLAVCPTEETILYSTHGIWKFHNSASNPSIQNSQNSK
jgi:hypothetical protein